MPKGRFVVTPTAWSPRGEAVLPGRPELVVWSGIPGEEGRVDVFHRGENRHLARWETSRRPDPRRVSPPCEKYHACGGCPLMHVAPAHQGDARLWLLRDALRHAGVEKFEIDPMVECPDGHSEYRHLLKLIAGRSDHGSPRMGAPGRNRRHIVAIPDCLAVTAPLRETMRQAVHGFLDLDIWPFVPGRGGVLRHVVARQSRQTGEILVTLVVAKETDHLRELAEALMTRQEAVAGVHVHVNTGPGNAIFAADGQGMVGTFRLAGRTHIVDRLADVDFHIGPADFFQTNPSVADLLYRDVVELAGAADGVPVVDLYSGVGGFALALALKTGWALGIEANEGAVRRSRNAASAGGIPAEFTHGEVLDELPEVAKRIADRRPVVIVDPARRGLEPGVGSGLMALNPRRVLYVSCNPRALARDLVQFQSRGWTVEKLRPYDMFPNTAHLEVVAVLVPPDGGDVSGVKRGPRRRVVRG